jgi:hypothetical protein
MWSGQAWSTAPWSAEAVSSQTVVAVEDSMVLMFELKTELVLRLPIME